MPQKDSAALRIYFCATFYPHEPEMPQRNRNAREFRDSPPRRPDQFFQSEPPDPKKTFNRSFRHPDGGARSRRKRNNLFCRDPDSTDEFSLRNPDTGSCDERPLITQDPENVATSQEKIRCPLIGSLRTALLFS
jgi:hypothetical protein